MKVFQDYAYYYNMFYKEKRYDKEAEDIELLFKRFGEREIHTILNLGCGTGKHDIELSKRGYHVDGIDLSPIMIQIAKEKNTKSKYEVADVRNYRTTEKYDAIVSLFHVVSYQNSNEDVLDTFMTANCALKMNGLFVFDVWHGAGVLRDLPTVRVKKVENKEKCAIRYATPEMDANTNVVNVKYDVLIVDKKTEKVEHLNEEHHMRYFFTPEIKEYLRECGFELVAFLDCNSLSVPDYSSWTVYYIAKKVKEI